MHFKSLHVRSFISFEWVVKPFTLFMRGDISFCPVIIHCLCAPQRTEYKLAVLVYRCLHGPAPSYLAEGLLLVSDVDSRRCFRSASTSAHIVPTTRPAVGDRVFCELILHQSINLWNSLLPEVTSTPTLTVFLNRLRTYLFFSIISFLTVFGFYTLNHKNT